MRLLDWSWLPLTGDVESDVRRIGGRQNAAAHIEQLRAAGLGRRAIQHRITSGRYEQCHPKVVFLDEVVPPPHRAEAGAALAAAPASLFGFTACAAWDFVRAAPARKVELLVARDFRTELDGVRVHRTTRLDRRDIRRRDGLLVPRPALALLQLAADTTVSEKLFQRAVAEAHVKDLAREPELRDVLVRYPRARGRPRREALLRRPGGIGRTKSDVERDMQALIREARLPMPLTNTPLHGLEVDAYWPQHRLVVEVIRGQAPLHVGLRPTTSPRYAHGSIASVKEDHRRALILEGAGEHVLPILDEQLLDDRLAVVATLAGQLARREPRLAA